MKTKSNIAKILDNLHFSEILGNQLISMKIISNKSNNIIDINIFEIRSLV